MKQIEVRCLQPFLHGSQHVSRGQWIWVDEARAKKLVANGLAYVAGTEPPDDGGPHLNHEPMTGDELYRQHEAFIAQSKALKRTDEEHWQEVMNPTFTKADCSEMIKDLMEMRPMSAEFNQSLENCIAYYEKRLNELS